MIVVEAPFAPFDYRHLADRRDRPSCGVLPAGNFVVDRIQDVTCPACVEISNYPRAKRATGGRS